MSDTCDCDKAGSQKYHYENSYTSFTIYAFKTELCIFDTLKISIVIKNKSQEDIGIFKDTSIVYKELKNTTPQILINWGNGFTSNIEYTVEMHILEPNQSQIVDLKIPVSDLMKKKFDNLIYLNIGYGYIIKIKEIESFAKKNDKYFLKSSNNLFITSSLVELFNKSFDLPIMGFRICKE